MLEPHMQIAIRPLRLDERVAWEPLWKRYPDFYRITVPQETYDATWARLHDPNEPMWLLGGYVDGKLLGIVHYTITAPAGRSATTAICRICSWPRARASSGWAAR